jgi:hypothetical protein
VGEDEAGAGQGGVEEEGPSISDPNLSSLRPKVSMANWCSTSSPRRRCAQLPPAQSTPPRNPSHKRRQSTLTARNSLCQRTPRATPSPCASRSSAMALSISASSWITVSSVGGRRRRYAGLTRVSRSRGARRGSRGIPGWVWIRQ